MRPKIASLVLSLSMLGAFASVPSAAETKPLTLPLRVLPSKQWELVKKIAPRQQWRNILQWSPDGRLLAYIGEKFTLIDEAGTKTEIGPKWYHAGQYALSRDFKVMAHNHGKHWVQLWDMETKKKTIQSKRVRWDINHVALGPRGRFFAVGLRHPKKVKFAGELWSAETGKRLARFDTEEFYPKIAFTADGSRMHIGKMAVDVGTRELLKTPCAAKPVFGPDGEPLPCGSIKDSELVRKRILAYHFQSNSFDPASGILADWRKDKIILTDIRAGEAVGFLSGDGTDVDVTAFSPDGETLAVATEGRVLLYKPTDLTNRILAVAAAKEKPSARDYARVREPLEAELRSKLNRLREEKRDQLRPKGEFETTAQYDARIKKVRDEEKRLRDESADKIRLKIGKLELDWKLDRDDLRKRPYDLLARAELERYDADKGEYHVRAWSLPFAASVPLEEAKKIKQHRFPHYVRGTARFLNSREVSIENVVLWNQRQAKEFPVTRRLKSIAPVAVKAAPNLRIESISLVEPSGDGFLDAKESGHIRLKVSNSGKGPAFGASLSLRLLEGAGVRFDERAFLGGIKPGESESFEAPVSGLDGLKRGRVRLEAVIREANSFDSRPVILAFKTREFQTPLLKLAKIDIRDPDGRGVFKKGKETEVALTVVNAGAGGAQGVRVRVKSSDRTVKVFGDDEVWLKELAPGRRKTARFNVIVTRRYKGPPELPLSFKIVERRPKFSAEPKVVLTLGREAPHIRVVEVATAAPAKRGKGLDAVPELAPAEKVFGPKDMAVVIGIERYRNVPASDYSRTDAKLVRSYLLALGLPARNIEFLTDDGASFTSVRKSLETVLSNRVKKDGRVFIYYSGHGAPDPATGQTYLVPYDGDPNYLADTAYPIKRLYERLGRLKAKEITVVMDACFSGAGGRSVLAKGARPLVMTLRDEALPPRVAVLSASRGSQISTSSPKKGHGILTYYFLRALQEGKKDLAGIYGYLKPLVEDEAKALNVEQTPGLSPRRLRSGYRFRR